MRWVLLATWIALVGCGSPTRPVIAPAPTPRAGPSITLSLQLRSLTLKNGLRVILEEDHHAPTVAVNVWYHVGSKDDPPGRSGFAHLFEHLMFQGSRHVDVGMHKRLLEAAGAQEYNAETDVDHTGFHETVPAHQLELALWLESDRMGFLLDRLDATTMGREREVVKNERRQRHENVPLGMVPSFTREALYPEGHPYRHLTIGEPKELDAATLDDVRTFFHRYYAPNNATLVLVGDFRNEAAAALVEKYFGAIPRGKDPLTVKHASQVELAKAKTVHVEAGTERGLLTMTWPTPPIYGERHCELAHAADLLPMGVEHALATEKLADRALSRYEPAQLGGTFSIRVQLRAGASPEAARAIVERALSAHTRAAVPAAVLTASRTRLYASLVFPLESVTSRARAFNFYGHMTDDPLFALELLRRFETVTSVGVASATWATVAHAHPVVTIVTPTPGAPIAGRLVKVVE